MRNKLLAKLHCIFKDKGVSTENKQDIYSGFGVSSASELGEKQLVELINSLDSSYKRKSSKGEVSEVTRGLRSEVLKVLTDSSSAKSERCRGLGFPSDFVVLNPFILNHAGKLLYQMNDNELKEFKKKLYAIRKSGWFYKDGSQNIQTNTNNVTVVYAKNSAIVS